VCDQSVRVTDDGRYAKMRLTVRIFLTLLGFIGVSWTGGDILDIWPNRSQISFISNVERFAMRNGLNAAFTAAKLDGSIAGPVYLVCGVILTATAADG
jgi:hypothetical protein